MKVRLFTQDPSVLPPVLADVPQRKSHSGPSDNRIAVKEAVDLPLARPNKNGDFIYDPADWRFDGCEAYGALSLGMDLYRNILKRDLPFAFPGQVRLLPHDDFGINAFYSRDDRAVHFLTMSSPKFNKFPAIKNQTLRMAQSLDVSAHEEVGHLLLDGLKPGYLNLELETQAFHEAFGDIAAMILTLQFDQVLTRMLEETKGDLRKSNLVSKLGEQAGIAIQALSRYPQRNHYFLRDATDTMRNDWKYIPSQELSDWNPENEAELGSEPHNFSRFFTGLWYEVLVHLYEQDPGRTSNPKGALQSARDVAASLIVRAAADFAPETSGTYPEIAKAMLQADEADYKGAHRNILTQLFTNRHVLSHSDCEPNNLPPVRLHGPIRTKEEAKIFLNIHQRELGIPEGVELQPMENAPSNHRRFVYQNHKQETFLSFHATRSKSLKGKMHRELEGAECEIRGSLKLGFSEDGKLFHVASDLITDGKENRINQSVHQLHENGWIASLAPGELPSGPRHVFKTLSENHKVPYIAYTGWKNGRKTIERVPVFC